MLINYNYVLPFIAYLLGSISSAVWIARTFHGINIREYGSGNAGATNILRVLGPKAALPVFLIDFVKGVLAVNLILLTDIPDPSEQYTGYCILLGAACIVGHIFPAFASFKGGKGVATIGGVLMAIAPLPMTLTLLVFVITLAISKYVSVASMSCAIAFPLMIIGIFGVFDAENVTHTLRIFSLIASVTIFITHRKNIERLRNGQESKVSFKKKANSIETTRRN